MDLYAIMNNYCVVRARNDFFYLPATLSNDIIKAVEVQVDLKHSNYFFFHCQPTMQVRGGGKYLSWKEIQDPDRTRPCMDAAN